MAPRRSRKADRARRPCSDFRVEALEPHAPLSADTAFVAIGPDTGALTFDAAPDFERPADTGTDGVHEVIVRASDAHGGSVAQAIAVTVTGVNEHPVITSADSVEVTENRTAVSTVTSVDVDGDVPFRSVVGGAEAALFSIDGATGVPSFPNAPDFGRPRDEDDESEDGEESGGDPAANESCSADDGSFRGIVGCRADG